MSRQIIRPRSPSYSPNARKAALETILRGGLNKVIWDDCRLIWDSRSIIGDTPNSEDQMAVYGVKGRVETPERQRLDFQIRYAVRFEPEPLYLVHAVLDKAVEDDSASNDEIEVVQSELPEGVDRRELFNEAVRSLTSKVVSIGLQATMESFLSLGGESNGSSHPINGYCA